jgi:hypothetical protein
MIEKSTCPSGCQRRTPISSIVDAVYNMNKCLNFSGKYVEKYRACLALLVQFQVQH